MAMANKPAAVFPKNAMERVQVVAKTYKGKPYIDARIFFQADDGEWRPTPKGLCLAPDLARQVAAAMAKAGGITEQQ